MVVPKESVDNWYNLWITTLLCTASSGIPCRMAKSALSETAASEWTPGVQFRHWRQRAGLLMQEAADQLRVSQQAISNWEGDVALPRTRIADLIDEVYGLKAGMTLAIIDRANPPTPPEGEDPLVVDIDDEGQLVWTVRAPVEQVAAKSGVTLEGLSRSDKAKAKEFIEFLKAQRDSK